MKRVKILAKIFIVLVVLWVIFTMSLGIIKLGNHFNTPNFAIVLIVIHVIIIGLFLRPVFKAINKPIKENGHKQSYSSRSRGQRS